MVKAFILIVIYVLFCSKNFDKWARRVYMECDLGLFEDRKKGRYKQSESLIYISEWQLPAHKPNVTCYCSFLHLGHHELQVSTAHENALAKHETSQNPTELSSVQKKIKTHHSSRVSLASVTKLHKGLTKRAERAAASNSLMFAYFWG